MPDRDAPDNSIPFIGSMAPVRQAMGLRWTLKVLLVLSFSVDSIAAEVEYRHPNLTIVARDEPLGSVLKSIGKEMRIFVTTPSAVNPVVNCDIQDQPLERAFKELLGGMSYTLEWKDDGEQLAGVTILAGSQWAGDAVADTSSESKVTTMSTDQTAPPGGGDRGNGDSGMPVGQGSAAAMAAYDRDAEMKAERVEQEARMAEERARREAEMVLRREQEAIAHAERMREEVARSEARMAEYIESQDLSGGL